MDPIYKPPSSLDVTKLPPRKPSPRGGMDTNVPTTPGHSPCNPHGVLDPHDELTIVDSQIEAKGPDELYLSQSEKPVAEKMYKPLPTNKMPAIQHEIELKQRHLKQLREQQTLLDSLNSEISNLELGFNTKYNNNSTSNTLNTRNLECPPIYRQINSHEHYMNQKIANLKNNLKIDEANEPRDELNFFEESCNVNDIHNPIDKYKILTAVWPAKDIKNYWAITEGKNKSYQSLKEFLLTKDGHFGRVFKPKPEWTSVSGLELDIEVKKWENELKKGSNLTKFLYLHLAPKELKPKIRRKLCLDEENFKICCKNICDVKQQQERDEGNNLNYWGSPNKNFKGFHNKKRNSQYRYHQANAQNNDYEPRMHQANVKYNNNSNNYNKFNTNDKVNNDNSSNRNIFPAHQSWKEKTFNVQQPNDSNIADTFEPYGPKNADPSCSK